MTKRNAAIHVQALLLLAPVVGVIFPWLQVLFPTAVCFVAPPDGPPFSETVLPLVGIMSLFTGFVAFVALGLTKTQSTLLLRLFAWGHIVYSVLAALIWLVFFGSRFIVHFPISEMGFYALFALSVVPHCVWIVLEVWCQRHLRTRTSLDTNVDSHSETSPKREPRFLLVPLAVLIAVFTAVLYEPSTPIHDAIQSRDLDSLRTILKENPDLVNREPMYDELDLPIIEAIRSEDEDMVRILLENGADANLSTDGITTPLVQAIRTGKPAMVKLLIDYGAYVNPLYVVFRTPLMEAVTTRDTVIVRLLLDAGADVNASTISGRGMSSDRIIGTALKTASEYGKPEIVQILLESGAEVNQQGPNDDAAIHMACRSHSRPSVAKNVLALLIGAGADINGKGYQGMTPLHLAAAGRPMYNPDTRKNYYEPVDTSVILYLLENGADPSIENADGQLAAECAQRNGHRKVAALLLDHAGEH